MYASRVRADLHIHTTASDGTLAPAKVVRIAASLGLRYVAIADHDTVDGVEEALAAARGTCLSIIPAVELSSVRDGRDIHVLGYFVNWRDRSFREHLGELRRMRLERVRRMLGLLAERGLELALEDVLKEANGENGSLGRPHIARALVRKKLLHSVEEAFERYLGRGAPCFVEKYEHDPVEVVATIRAAGGIPVLAHPGLHLTEEIVAELAGAGLLGIEAFHSDHDPATERRLLRLARGLGLVVTGGSDCHGVGSERGLRIGSRGVPTGLMFRVPA